MLNFSSNYFYADDIRPLITAGNQTPRSGISTKFDSLVDYAEANVVQKESLLQEKVRSEDAALLLDYRWPIGAPDAKDYFVQEQFAVFVGTDVLRK